MNQPSSRRIPAAAPLPDTTWEPVEPTVIDTPHPNGILRNVELLRIVANDLFEHAPSTRRTGRSQRS